MSPVQCVTDVPVHSPRSDLKKILQHVVIVGANEYLGPEIVAHFDIPILPWSRHLAFA
jgi:hypothetical protein